MVSPRRRRWHPTPVLLPGKFHGWRSLVGCSPWDHWESDMTEWLHFYFSLSCIGEGNGSPLQCSCLENPRDRGAWWAAVYGVAQSRTRLKQLSSSSMVSPRTEGLRWRKPTAVTSLLSYTFQKCTSFPPCIGGWACCPSLPLPDLSSSLMTPQHWVSPSLSPAIGQRFLTWCKSLGGLCIEFMGSVNLDRKTATA